MSNCKKVRDALDSVFEHLKAMPEEEFRALMLTEEAKMREAILNGHDHLGLAIWRGQDPDAARAYVQQVRRESAK